MEANASRCHGKAPDEIEWDALVGRSRKPGVARNRSSINLGYTKATAPFDGVLTARQVSRPCRACDADRWPATT